MGGLRAAPLLSPHSITMLDLYTIGAVLLTLISGVNAADGRTKCRFPAEWKGRWYQSGLGEVSIRTNSIVQKGVCVENNQDLFLVENRQDGCFQCLLMLPRHSNIIQYKESYCMERDTRRRICNTIQPEAPLYTLVREPFTPTSCPFQAAYYFNYKDQMSGFCDSGISYVKPCAGHSRFQFHFKHCNPLAERNGKDFNFECIATWKDGSDMFLYGKFYGSSITTKGESYRCFKYLAYGSEINMAMSADATCLGLPSYSDGPTTMRFTKDTSSRQQPKCDFPDEFAGSTWRDLAGRHVYEIDGRERGRILMYIRRRRSERTELKSEFRCMEIVSQNHTSRTTVIQSYTSHGCVDRHQCLMVHEVHPNLMEIRLGHMMDHASPSHCSTNEEDYADAHILIPEVTPETPCPYPGRHAMTSTIVGCQGDFSSGCNQSHQMDIGCSSDGQDKVTSLICLVSWRAPNQTHVVARRMDQPHEPPNCYVFTESATHVTLHVDTQCTGSVGHIFTPPLSVRLQRTPEECALPDFVAEYEDEVEVEDEVVVGQEKNNQEEEPETEEVDEIEDYIYTDGNENVIVEPGADTDNEGFYQHIDRNKGRGDSQPSSSPPADQHTASSAPSPHTGLILLITVTLLMLTWPCR